MNFYQLLDQVTDLLRQRGRLTYRSLKLQFGLDDEMLEALKDELLFANLVVDEAGRGLAWNADPAIHEPDAAPRVEAELRFQLLLRVVIALLKSEGCVTYRTLKHIPGLDDMLLEEIREELTLRRLATDQEGKVLVWTGKASSDRPASAAVAPHDEPPGMASTRIGPEAERRQLTVMFCDLADSTILSQQLDPEDLREVIRAYQQTSAEVIARFDGYIAQHLGDGLLVYFGWPQAHEDDAQRALHAGLGIVYAITRSLNPHPQQERGVQLTVRVGIHTGPVVVGEMGGGGRHENLATGETVNIAARLEGLAAPNTVVISNVTARLVRDAFALDDLGHHDLKGVAEPMQVFQVLHVREADPLLDEAMPDGGRYLVGRDEEVGILMRRWEQSKEGLGQAVMISGEAGIGKSSLVTTIRHHVAQAGCVHMTFRCSPYHTNSALYPVIEHVQRGLGFQRGDTAETRLVKLEEVLGGYSRPLGEVVPLYADLLSVALPEGRYTAQNVTPQQKRQQTQDALVG